MSDHTIPVDKLRAAKRWLLELDEAIADGSPLVDGTVEVADIIRSLPDPEPTPVEDLEEANRWADDVLAGIVRPERADMHAVARTVKRVKLPAFDNESGDAMTWAERAERREAADTHPDALRTVGDYASAPAGTMIHDGDPFIAERWFAALGHEGKWHFMCQGTGPYSTLQPDQMPGTFGVGHVLQWGDK